MLRDTRSEDAVRGERERGDDAQGNLEDRPEEDQQEEGGKEANPDGEDIQGGMERRKGEKGDDG